MKNIYKLIFSLVLITGFYSCDETVEPTIYNGDESTNRTFLSFPATIVNLPVAIDATGSVTLTLNSSTKSSTDRTFNINLVNEADIEEGDDSPFTTANPLTFSLPSTLTIPADSYQASITIMGMDNNLVEPASKQIVFKLEGLSANDDMDTNQVIVNIFEVCPIVADFSGSYLMEQVTPINPCDGVQFFENQIVEIASTGDTSRSFSAIYLEGISASFPLLRIDFSLVCNEVIVNVTDTGLGCSGGTTPPINVGPAATPSTYIATEDSVFEVTINEYFSEDAECGCTPYDTTFRFTKQ
ncbi:hypothetical protein [Hyunsoonleella aestuarii]|uniref:DUF1735 domain-containing protein n=1 Tax=Hyunsoonleella aestuarii TaxID=912802 RepID=A0ABP8E7R0_9FLAO|nr:hypothetical protein [Hyunsoonleella aestuarii]